MKQSKYRAIPTVIEGIRFDSKLEASRYKQLLLLQRGKSISHLELQIPFKLVVNGLLIGRYVCDFSYFDNEAKQQIYEDTKGVRTDLYKWKKKHVEAQFGIKITEVTK